MQSQVPILIRNLFLLANLISLLIGSDSDRQWEVPEQLVALIIGSVFSEYCCRDKRYCTVCNMTNPGKNMCLKSYIQQILKSVGLRMSNRGIMTVRHPYRTYSFPVWTTLQTRVQDIQCFTHWTDLYPDH